MYDQTLVTLVRKADAATTLEEVKAVLGSVCLALVQLNSEVESLRSRSAAADRGAVLRKET